MELTDSYFYWQYIYELKFLFCGFKFISNLVSYWKSFDKESPPFLNILKTRYSSTKRNMEVLIDRYTHMQVIEELPLLKMSTYISGHPKINGDVKHCICSLHHLTIFCNWEVYLAIPK